MSGGAGAEESAEVILKDGSTCTLPDLPPPGRYQHSATGLTLCGGWVPDVGESNTCSTFTGEWGTSHKMKFPRRFHVSWDSTSGIFIMGGTDEQTRSSTEILSAESETTTPCFKTDGI